ncbi:MAG: methylmalonyl-CoA mutase [Thermoflexales bacterium]|nr:methylmalonyl-CoA mutase [Thermoflexales bacterium]
MTRTRADWERDTLRPSLTRAPERRVRFETPSGIPFEVVHGDGDFPGEYPFTRGVHPTMYRSRLWTMRQYAGFASAQESNARYRFLLSQGQTGLSVAFDLPTQLAMDADDALAAGEVGKVGVSVSTLGDMRVLLDKIPLDKVSTSMTINAPAALLLALYIAVGQEQGVAMRALRGTVQNDILKEYAARGLYVFPPGPSMRLVTDVFAFCAAEMPSWNTISISGYHIREAGSTAAQEIAFTLANAIAYVEAALKAGMSVDDFAGQLAFFFNAHNHFLEEVAKFRAARRLWAKIMRERFGARDPRSCMLRFHTQTGGSTLTASQPVNNVARVTIQALAAVMGGAQSLHTNGMDEALQLPTEEAVRVALRTQQIIAHESGATETVDPLGGSHALEYLTDALEQRAAALIASIDAQGGAVKAIESGWMQAQIADAAYAHQKDVESGQRVIVGVNEFVEDAPAAAAVKRFKVDASIEARQRARLADWRAGRSAEAVAAQTAALERAAQGSDNLMPVLIDCVRAGLTVGEIGTTLRRIFGAYTPPTAI